MNLIGIFCVVLTAVFIGLKLANVIAWSWLWVLSPIWIPIVAVIGFFAIMLIRDILDEALGF